MSLLRRFAASFSVVGLLLGLAFFAASLTPSLLPRPVLVQGVLSGVVFAAGYGLGVLGRLLWRYMELRDVSGPWLRALNVAAVVLLLGLALATLSRMTAWQNELRGLMSMDPIDSAYPLSVLWISALTALVLIVVVRLALVLARGIVRAAARVLPRRVAIVVGGGAFLVLVVTLVNGVLLRAALDAADQGFAAVDRLLDDDTTPPTNDKASGSANSLIAWDEIGRNGKRFILEGPTKGEIATLLGREARQPLRVYAGFRTGEDIEERAEIALAELERVGGFDRSVLIVAVATGTGWLDPSSVDPVEYLLAGDVATVSLQYSYLPSWLTLLVEPELAAAAGRALFRRVYDRWTTLPPDARPKLYSFGLSLGSLGSEHAVDLVTIFADPIQGALWVGPPFVNPKWSRVTEAREPATPAWRPVYRNSAMFRFMTQDGFPDLGDASWGPCRIVYLQYPSDPMTFFRKDLLYREPDWLQGERGRDVSPSLRWFPVVTFFQVAFDLSLATSVPLGYGHSFAPRHYIDAWLEVLSPPGWSEANTERLKAHFADFAPTPL